MKLAFSEGRVIQSRGLYPRMDKRLETEFTVSGDEVVVCPQ